MKNINNSLLWQISPLVAEKHGLSDVLVSSGFFVKRICKLSPNQSGRINQVSHCGLTKPIPQVVKEPHHLRKLSFQSFFDQRWTGRSLLKTLPQNIQDLIPNHLDDLSFVVIEQIEERVSHQISFLAQNLLKLHRFAAGRKNHVQDGLHVWPKDRPKAGNV